MIQSNKFGKMKFSDMIAFMIFIQNICIGQQRCSPKCPLKDPYFKCKIVASPSYLGTYNNYMYSKLAMLYPLFARLRAKCMFGSGCRDCELHIKVDGSRYFECAYYHMMLILRRVINSNLTSWRHKR